MLYKDYYHSPIGKLTLVSNEENLIGLWMEGQKYFLSTIQEEPQLHKELAILQKTKKWLDAYFNFQKPPIEELSLAPQGSAFRQQVWKILCEIPYGEVTTYGEIAKQIAQATGIQTMSAQAIGNAVGHNPISIIIPCHRVVGTNGSLTGYAGGLDIKVKLLTLEGVAMNQFSRPSKGTAL